MAQTPHRSSGLSIEKSVASTEKADAPQPQPPIPDESNDSSRRLIAEFYRRWSGTPNGRPGAKELALAEEIVEQYGADEATGRLLPVVVKLLKQNFPDAQNFGATRGYWSRAEHGLKKIVAQEKSIAVARREEQRAESDRRLEREQKAALRRRWAELSESEQQRIDRLAYESADEFVRQRMDSGRLSDPLVELARLQALKQQDTQNA